MKTSYFFILVTVFLIPLSSCQANTSLPYEPEQTEQLTNTAWPEDTSTPEYAFLPEDFIGEWVATEVAAVPDLTTSDFYPEKYIGHIIHIEKDCYYMDFWEGYLTPEDKPVEYYSIEEYDQWTYENIDNKVYFPYHWDPMLLLYKNNKERKEEIGIVIDADTLICVTGTGFYKYERIKQ